MIYTRVNISEVPVSTAEKQKLVGGIPKWIFDFVVAMSIFTSVHTSLIIRKLEFTFVSNSNEFNVLPLYM